MYQAKPITEGIEVSESVVKFEDENCIVYYNFWGENGDIGFTIYNKNVENLYLHLDECFYVENGFAYDYYQNRVNTISTIVAGIMSVEKKIICIPSRCSKHISEFNINKQLYRNCDMPLYPGKKDNNTLRFTMEDSPFVFGNRLAYSIGDAGAIIRVNNDFYISKIYNRH